MSETEESNQGPTTPVGKAYLEDTRTIRALTGNITEQQRIKALNGAIDDRLRILKLKRDLNKP